MEWRNFLTQSLFMVCRCLSYQVFHFFCIIVDIIQNMHMRILSKHLLSNGNEGLNLVWKSFTIATVYCYSSRTECCMNNIYIDLLFFLINTELCIDMIIGKNFFLDWDLWFAKSVREECTSARKLLLLHAFQDFAKIYISVIKGEKRWECIISLHLASFRCNE